MARRPGEIGRIESGTAGLLRFDEVARTAITRATRRLPAFTGETIRVQFHPALTIIGGKLHSGRKAGTEVHAASYLTERRLVLDSELLCYPSELRRILLHELFHFVWRRLGNPKRSAWEEVLRRECKDKAKGELGWSAEWRKDAMRPADVKNRTLRWRQYACESFCDTAAWLWGPPHAEHTLAARFRNRRKLWLQGIATNPLSI